LNSVNVRIEGKASKLAEGVSSDWETFGFAIRSTVDVFSPGCGGSDAVVDSDLRVHGIRGLRVADGSVIPSILAGPTNAPCIMIGGRAADMIKACA